MGKRTSDFIALAAIVCGVVLGLGVTGLVLGPAEAPNGDESSMRVYVLHDGVGVDRNQSSVRYRLDRDPLQRLRLQREKLLFESLAMRELDREQREKLRGLMGELRALEDLDLGQSLTIDFRGDDEDQRRRRRRRRPPRR